MKLFDTYCLAIKYWWEGDAWVVAIKCARNIVYGWKQGNHKQGEESESKR